MRKPVYVITNAFKAFKAIPSFDSMGLARNLYAYGDPFVYIRKDKGWGK